jgi:hypothetical protein
MGIIIYKESFCTVPLDFWTETDVRQNSSEFSIMYYYQCILYADLKKTDRGFFFSITAVAEFLQNVRSKQLM